MWDAIKLLGLVLFLCALAMVGEKMENIISQNPSSLEFTSPVAVMMEKDRVGSVIRSQFMRYEEKTRLSLFQIVKAEITETDSTSPHQGEITTITSRVAENRDNQTIFRRDVVIQNPREEFLFTDELQYYPSPHRRVFCPSPVEIRRPGLLLSGDVMDNIDSPLLKKFHLQGHVHLEITETHK